MNEVLKALKERRSIRKYKTEQIKDSELELILEGTLPEDYGLLKLQVTGDYTKK